MKNQDHSRTKPLVGLRSHRSPTQWFHLLLLKTGVWRTLNTLINAFAHIIERSDKGMRAFFSWSNFAVDESLSSWSIVSISFKWTVQSAPGRVILSYELFHCCHNSPVEKEWSFEDMLPWFGCAHLTHYFRWKFLQSHIKCCLLTRRIQSTQHTSIVYLLIYTKKKTCPKKTHKKCLPPTVSGYFMGAASWSQSFDTLSHNDNGPARDVYAIDWPSWGLSGRENFPSQQGTDVCYLESDFFFGGGIMKQDTRYYLYCLCCLYQLLLLYLKFQCFLIFFCLRKFLVCACLSQKRHGGTIFTILSTSWLAIIT